MTRIALAIAMLFALGAALVLPAQPAQAAPAAQEARPVIAQPEPDATVRGVVQILGTATHPQFQRYELYYAPFPVRSDQSWVFIGPDAHFQQQPLGMLGTWDSRAVPDGSYALRVRVVKADAELYRQRTETGDGSQQGTRTDGDTGTVPHTRRADGNARPHAGAGQPGGGCDGRRGRTYHRCPGAGSAYDHAHVDGEAGRQPYGNSQLGHLQLERGSGRQRAGGAARRGIPG